PKFTWGAAVSNHPGWRWQAAAGVALAVLVFGAALAACWRRRAPLPRAWAGIAASVVASGTMIGWVTGTIPVQSPTVGDWMRSLAWGAVALLSPVVGAAAVASEARIPSFARVLGRGGARSSDPLALALGALLIGLTLLAVQAGLGLVFDPRYRDFPLAAFTPAVVSFALPTS